MSDKEQELHNSYLWHNKPMEYGEWCYLKGKEDAIEEFMKAIEKHQQDNWIDNLEYGITFADLEEVAEQLKEKK